MNLNEIDFGELVQDIKKYNSQFGLGNILGSIIDREITGGEKEGLDLEIESQLSWGNIELKFKDELTDTGLSLETIDGNATIYIGDDKFPSSQMRINIKNGKAFVQYLNSLSQETLTDNQRYGLEEVAESITFQLSHEYKLDDPEDERVLNIFGHLEPVINSYRKLGLSESTKQLSEYLDFARKGYLLDYLIVQREGLFAEIGGKNFGPSEWHTDANPEHYQKMWDKALDMLDRVRKNTRATELSDKLRTHLKKSAEYAQQDIKENPAIVNYVPEPQRQVFKETLMQVVLYLS